MSMALLGPFGRIALDAPVYTLGSAPDNQLVLYDPKVSPRHAVLRLQGQQYSIVDLGSMDGTYLNDQRLGPNMPAFIKHGDRLRLGDTVYTVEASPTAAPMYPPTVAANSSSSPAYDPTVLAQQPPVSPAYGQVPQAPQTPAFGQSNPGLPPYGQAPQTPAFGQSNPALPPYGQAPQAPAFGQSNPNLPSYGQAPQAPAFGQSNPNLPPYGQAPQAPAFGQSNPNLPSYGQIPPTQQAPVYGQSNPGLPNYAPTAPFQSNAPMAPAPGQPWGASMPPGYVPPVQPQKKSNMKVLVIILVIILVLGGVGGGITVYVLNLPQPTISVTSLYHVGATPAGASATTFTVSGKRFSHSSTITFLLDGTQVPGSSTIQSDTDGLVKDTTLTVTDSWSTGTHTLTAKDAAGYITKVGVPITIVTPGEDKTPGPNGAPTDSATGTIDATIQSSQGTIPTVTLNVSGGANGDTICQDIDNGQSRVVHETSSDGTATADETLTTTCSGTYKGGKLTYTETVTSDQIVFTSGSANGLTCTAQVPYVHLHLEGTFTSATAINGSATSDVISLTCKLGTFSQSTTIPSNSDTWTGIASMQ